MGLVVGALEVAEPGAHVVLATSQSLRGGKAMAFETLALSEVQVFFLISCVDRIKFDVFWLLGSHFYITPTTTPIRLQISLLLLSHSICAASERSLPAEVTRLKVSQPHNSGVKMSGLMFDCRIRAVVLCNELFYRQFNWVTEIAWNSQFSIDHFE